MSEIFVWLLVTTRNPGGTTNFEFEFYIHSNNIASDAPVSELTIPKRQKKEKETNPKRV